MVANTDYWYRCSLTPLPLRLIPYSSCWQLTYSHTLHWCWHTCYQKIASFRGSLWKHGDMEPCCRRFDGTGLQVWRDGTASVTGRGGPWMSVWARGCEGGAEGIRSVIGMPSILKIWPNLFPSINITYFSVCFSVFLCLLVSPIVFQVSLNVYKCLSDNNTTSASIGA